MTAQRREQSLQDVPISMTAISADLLKNQNVESVEDYFALTPNVSFQSNGSRDRKELSIRGISNQVNPYADIRQSGYAFYIDEFNVAAGTSNPQIVDLERIEILRGPQGTYFGRNSVGGAINVTTKKPVDRFEGEIELGYSRFDTKRVQGVLNVPVIPGLLAIRASGQYQKTDGNIRNINPIGGGNGGTFKTGRIQARLTPTSDLTLDLTYSASDEEIGMRSGVPTGFVSRTWASVYYKSTPGMIADPDGIGFFPANRSQVNFNRPQKVGTKFDYLSGRLQWDLGGASLTAVAGHLDATVFNLGDVDGSSHDFFYEEFYLDRESTSGELRLQSDGNQFFEWSVGTSYGKDIGTLIQNTYNGAESPLCPASYNGQCNGLEATGYPSRSTTRYFALFGQGTINMTDQLSLTGGVRYSWEKNANLSSARGSGVLLSTNDRQATFEDVSPKFTLSYKPDTNWLVFATASRGFKSGGTQIANNPALPNQYDPETLWNYEVGTKFDLFDRKLRFDITGFYMDWKNVHQFVRYQFINDNGVLINVTGIANAAAAESYGVEASMDARITSQWTLSAQAGFNKTRYIDYPNALIDGNVIDVSGQQLTNAPEWTLGAQTQYTAPLADGVEAFGRLEWNFRDKMISTPLAYRYPVYPFISPSYHVVNARLGVEAGRFRATVFVENLFNAKYYANTYEKAFYSGVAVEPSYRNVGATIGYKF